MLTQPCSPALPVVLTAPTGQCDSCCQHRPRVLLRWPDTQFEVCLDCLPKQLTPDDVALAGPVVPPARRDGLDGSAASTPGLPAHRGAAGAPALLPDRRCALRHPITGQKCRNAEHAGLQHSWGSTPRSVVLCGSMAYFDVMLSEAARLTEQDLVVLLPVLIRPEFPRAPLAEVHRRKIELADAVHIVNVCGYVGPSTSDELAYARSLGKPVTFYEPPDDVDELPLDETGRSGFGRVATAHADLPATSS